MSNAISTITNTLTNSPLPLLIEKLGLSIAEAQAALDANSVATAAKMAATKVDIGGQEYNLIGLGFTPTFYAFTEASIEAKMEFSMSESESFSGSLSLGIQAKVVAVSVSASYARKFDMSAEGSSSIATRMVSLPAPENLKQILNEIAVRVDSLELVAVNVDVNTAGDLELSVNSTETIITAEVKPSYAKNKTLAWTIESGNNSITKISSDDTKFVFKTTATAGTLKIKATVVSRPEISKEVTFTVS